MNPPRNLHPAAKEPTWINYWGWGSGDMLGAGAQAVITGWLFYFFTTFCGLSAVEAGLIRSEPMEQPVKAARLLTLLLMWGSAGWFVLCMGSAAMQTSSENQNEVMRFAWPPLVLSALVAASVLRISSKREQWKPAARPALLTLRVSLGCLAILGIGYMLELMKPGS